MEPWADNEEGPPAQPCRQGKVGQGKAGQDRAGGTNGWGRTTPSSVPHVKLEKQDIFQDPRDGWDG